MKKLLLIACAALMTLGAQAQFKTLPGLRLEKQEGSKQDRALFAKAPQQDLGERQQYMGPSTTDNFDKESGIGLTSSPGTYKIAAFVPTEILSQYDGGKVVGMRFALFTPANTTEAFIGYVDRKTRDYKELAKASISNTVAGWNYVTFDAPVTLDLSAYEAIMLGYDYVQTKTNYPVGYTLDGPLCKTYLYGNPGSGYDWYDIGLDELGNLAVQAIVENDYKQTGIHAFNFADTYVQLDNETNATVYMLNKGVDGVSSLDYTVSIDGVEGEETHYEMPEKVTEFNGMFTFDVPFKAAAEPGKQAIEIKITKVNGNPNTEPSNTAKGNLYTVPYFYQHNVVVEELTGCGCQYCPYGWQGMENLRETFGDRFIGIALHQYDGTVAKDAMNLPTKNYAQLDFNGAPYVRIERGPELHAYYGSGYSICEDFGEVLKNNAYAEAEVTATWNADKTAVNMTASVETIMENKPLQMEFVLVADGLTGEIGFRQVNAFASYAAKNYPEDLQKFCKGGEFGKNPIKLTYNDVAIASSYTESVNALPPLGVLTPFTRVEQSLTINMPTYAKLVQAIKDANYDVWAVAIIIDAETQLIMNATKVKVVEDPTGIKAVDADTRSEAVYNIAGQRLVQPQKGINIRGGKKFVVR